MRVLWVQSFPSPTLAVNHAKGNRIEEDRHTSPATITFTLTLQDFIHNQAFQNVPDIFRLALFFTGARSH